MGDGIISVTSGDLIDIDDTIARKAGCLVALLNTFRWDEADCSFLFGAGASSNTGSLLVPEAMPILASASSRAASMVWYKLVHRFGT